jgi:hypothetical protein
MPYNKKEMRAYQRRRKVYLRKKSLERLRRAQSGGFVQINIMVDKRDNDALQLHARTLKIPKVSVARAVVKAGMKHITTSAIIQEQQRWLTLFNRPAVPRYPGSDFDPKLRGRGPKKRTEEAASA